MQSGSAATPTLLLVPDASRPASACATPVGAQGATPEASPACQPQHGLGASPCRQQAGPAAELDSMGSSGAFLAPPSHLAISIPPVEAEDPGKGPRVFHRCMGLPL